jgi:glycosyltransferase involved in cell wall biosynthesis
MSDKISVIAPIYNGEEHLDGFFKGLLAQTYPNIEIICVDDGSTDGTYEALKRYSAKDDRIVVVRQENAGAGIARNTGLAKATGEYCSFLDCDDTFEPNMYEALYKKCSETNADICICDADAIVAATGKPNPDKRFIDWPNLTDKDVFSFRDMPERIFNIFSPVPWNKLFRTSFIREKGLQFQNTQNTNDVCFVFSALIMARRVTVIDDILIHKSIIVESVSRSSSKKWDDPYLAYTKLRDDLKAAGLFAEVERSFVNKAMETMLWTLPLLSEEGYESLFHMLKNGGLASLGIRERDDSDTYYIHANKYERARSVMHSSAELYRLKQIDRGEIMSVKVRGSSLHLRIKCPPAREGSFTGIAIEHQKFGSDADKAEELIFTYPAKAREKSDCIIVSGTIPLDNPELKETYWKISCVFESEGEKSLIYPLYDATIMRKIRIFFSRNYCLADGRTVFYTPFRKTIRIVVRNSGEYDSALFRFKELIAVGASMLLKRTLRRRRIILIHEKYCYRAADNGYALFKHCMENGAEKRLGREIYYVIDKRSPHYEKVRQWDRRVLDYLSIKHILYSIHCSLMVSSESRTHDYVRYVTASIAKPLIGRVKHMYLKHGIFGIKKVAPAPLIRNRSVLVTAVSQRERSILHDYIGYARKDIAVTGSARFDSLRDESGAYKEILLMSTIRNNLFHSGEQDFAASDYYRMYSDLLNSERLSAVMQKYGYTLNYFLHPSFGQFEHLFESERPNIRIVRDGDEQIDDLLRRCKMLITDYSSVAWDVLYMNKPILFFQFDLDTFAETPGSYLDMRTELPGDRCETVDDLLQLIESYASSGFRMPERYAALSHEFFDHTDSKNCERIVAELKKRGL